MQRQAGFNQSEQPPQPHPPLPDPPSPPTCQPPHHQALPLYLKLTFIGKCQGFSRCHWWVIIDTPKSYESVLWNCRQSPFSGRLYLVFLKCNWTELLNFCQLELFPPLLNHLKTTCFPLVFSPVTGVLFSNVQAITLCNTKQNFALKSPNTITSYFSVSSILLGLTVQMYSQLICFPPSLSRSHYSLTKTCLLVPLCVHFFSLTLNEFPSSTSAISKK